MIKTLSNRFASLLARNEIIENEDYEIYRYGFEMLIYFILNISVGLLIGAIFGKLIHTIVFLACYCTLRQFTGGYHAKNYTECTLSFILVYLAIIFIESNIDIEKYKYVIAIVMAISFLVIYKMAPQEHRNKPLNDKEKKYYRKCAIKIQLITMILFTLSIVSGLYINYIVYAVFAIVCIAILLVVGKYIKH